MPERLCPLCDRDWETTTCPVHGVPTIGPADGPPARLEVGTVLVDRYRIDGLLGQGGMGALLSATDLHADATVVIKVLRGERVHEIANVRRFYQEARAARALCHPNIVKIIMFGVDEATRAPFLAMEFVPGRTLKALVADEGPVDERMAAAIFVSIGRALSTAHAANVLHRDLKPSNIMVEPAPQGPQVKVLDFGLAKILEDPGTAPLTQPGKTVGTPAFMSPEQVTQGHQDFRTDLYGLGCVLHAALTGAPPFTGPDLVEVMRNQMRSPAPPLPPVLADGKAPSPGLRRIHAQLLAKDPDQRPSSTEAVVDAFAALMPKYMAAAMGAGFAQLEQLDTQVDHNPAPLSPEIDPPAADATDAGRTDAENVMIGGEDPTWGHQVTAADPPRFTMNSRFDLEDSKTEGLSDLPSPLLHRAARDPQDLAGTLSADDDPESSDASLTSVMPASLDDAERPETATPALPTTATSDPFETDRDTPSDAYETVAAEPGPTPARPARAPVAAVRTRPVVVERGWGRLTTPPPVPDPAAPTRTSGWLLALLVLSAGLALGVVATLTPARPIPTTKAPLPMILRAGSAVAVQGPDGPGALIEVRSDPPGAEVIVEDEWIGTTPVMLDRPANGRTVEVRFQQRGYQGRAIKLRPDTLSPVEVELVATEGGVEAP